MKSRSAAVAAALAIGLPALAGSGAGPAPQFTLRARDGRAVSLAQYHGQVVMINFWASWCGPCRQEMPLLESIYRKYHKLGFTLLDRKSTRLNSSHLVISYAVFCLKKKNKTTVTCAA